jgi:transposase
MVEQGVTVSEACRRAKVSRKTYYHWKPRYEKEGVDGLREPRSHAVHNPRTIDPQIERRIIELRREHPNWGKKRIAQWIWKEHCWKRAVAIETVRNVLKRHGLWKNGERKKKRKNRGTTADSPNKTMNIDLCFVHAKEVHEPNFSAFFQQMDELCEKSPEKGEEGALTAEDCGLAIFSHEKRSYDEKMDAYVLMRNNEEDKREDSKKTDIGEMERKAGIKREEEELRAWRRNIRIERKKEDEEWREYRGKRIKLKKRVKEMSKGERKRFEGDKKRSDEEWWRKRDERRELKAKRDKEDEKWRNKRKEIKDKMNLTITSLVAILVIIDNCTRKCLGLPVFIKGRKVTADDVIKALENLLPPELRYIISDNGKQFVAEAFQRLCANKGVVHVRITRHRPATNGIAERFIGRLKEMLAEREWKDVEELRMVLEEVISAYNDAPHQGLDGLSPNEYERRLMCVVSG